MTAPRAPAPYGPNTAMVRRFLQRLAGKPVGDCVAAARAYLSLQSAPEFASVDRALGAAIDGADRGDARDAVVGPIVQLMGTHSERLSQGETAGIGADDLAEAALAAALALIARDLLPEPTFELLYGPYRGLIPLDELGDR